MLKRPIIDGVPLLPITIAFVFGIILRLIGLSFITIGCLTIISVIITIFKHYHWATITISIALGVTISILHLPTNADKNIIGQTIVCRGFVTESRETDAAQLLRIEVSETGNNANTLSPCRKFTLQAIIPGFNPSIESAEIITFSAIISHVDSRIDLPDEISSSKFLIHDHIYMTAMVSPENIISHKKSDGIKAFFMSLKKDLTKLIYTSQLSNQAKIFLNTTLAGDSSDLTDEMRQSFSATGLAHILALSGLHIGLITILITLLLYPLYCYGHRKICATITIIILWLYAAITGFSPSVTRAVIMATIYLTARIIERKTSSLNSLCLAALIILIADPKSLTNIGFQLSFAAVAAILLLTKPLNPISSKKRLLHNTIAYICVSIAAMLGTALISIIYFHSLPIYFLLANIIASLILPIIILPGFLLIFLNAIGIDAPMLCDCINFIYDIFSDTNNFIGSLPGCNIDNIYISPWILIPYSATIITLYLWLTRKRLKWGLIFSAFTMITATSILFYPKETSIPTLYIGRNTYRTDLIINGGANRLDIISSAPHEANDIKLNVLFRYRDFMGKRDIDSIKVITSSSAFGHGYTKQDNIIQWNNKRIALITNSDWEQQVNCDYAIVCRGYTDSISTIAASFLPDTIIISYDLHPQRAQRYINECSNLGLPHIWLRQQSWSLPWSI